MSRETAIKAAAGKARWMLAHATARDNINDYLLPDVSDADLSDLAQQVATAIVDAALPHLAGDPVGYLTVNPDGWAISPHIRTLADEQRTVGILNETYGEGHYRVVALIPVDES